MFLARCPTRQVLLVALALLPACGGGEAPSATSSGELPSAGGAEASHPPGSAAPSAGDDRAVPLSGPAALAALRANVAETGARAEHTEETVEVAHILISFEECGLGVKRSREQAEQLAADLLARAVAGEDFESLRKEHSDDKGSTYKLTTGRRTGGAYARGGMVQGFGDVSWRLQVGQIGVTPFDAKQSPFGWHIVKRVK